MKEQNQNIELTIVIATYNAASTLKRALESVISQSYQNWECLIVDGLSKDNTLQIIQYYEEIDNRIRHISESDKGIYDAFNKGWKLAKGKWIYYLGSDDILTHNGIEELMSYTRNIDSQVAIVSGGVIRITQEGKHRILMSKGFQGSHQSMVTQKKILDILNGFNLTYKILADYDLFIKIKNNGYKVLNTKAIVAYFSAGGMSENLKNIVYIFREKYSILKQDKYCKRPLLKTSYDVFRTVFGAIYHNTLKAIKNK